MAVGTIASLSVSASTTSIAISFAKPANCTKVIFTLTPKNPVGSAISKTYTVPAGSIGTQLTYNFTGLSSTQKYTLSGTPYNGSAAGTARIYYNSNSSPVNTVKMPSAITTNAQNNFIFDALTTTLGNPPGAVTQSSPTGATANGGTIVKSSSAGSNTPTFLAGTTDAVVPSDLNAPGRLSLAVRDLAPNQTYAIKVRAETTDVDGKRIYSEYSSPIYVTTPGFSAIGTNNVSVNNNGDIKLDGGSLFAGDFGTDVGLFDVVNGTTTGTGIILNSTGIAGFKTGAKTFYIDSATGNAVFAGSVDSNASIAGTLASVVASNAYNGNALVATALKMVGSQISNATGQIQYVGANGTTFYSGASATSGARLLVNQYGILGYDTGSTADLDKISFAITSTSFSGTDKLGNAISLPAGSAYFSGVIAASTITGGTITGSTIKTSSGSYGITITSSGGASDSIKLVNTVGTAEIKLSTDANGLHIVPIGGTGGVDGLTLYGSGSAGVPNTIISRETLLIKQDDPDLVNNTSASLLSAKNIKIAHYAASGTPGTGGPYYNGDIFLQYTP